MSGIMKLRPARPEDEPFLRQLRGQVDADRLCMNLWRGEGVDVEKAKILDLQFRAQAAHHNVLKANWETRENIIEMDAVSIGRFVITGGGEELRLVEIALVPQWRGQGIGQMVIGATREECVRSGRVLRLCVEKTNQRAIALYLAQGFYVIENEAMHFVMEWSAKGPTGGKVHYFAMPKA